MEEENKSSTTKKTIFFIIGALLVVGTLTGGSLKYLGDWSTAQLAGYNVWSLIAIIGGAYMIYLGAKK